MLSEFLTFGGLFFRNNDEKFTSQFHGTEKNIEHLKFKPLTLVMLSHEMNY